MTADPKKNNEIKDEDLNQVAGGAGQDFDRPQDSGEDTVPPPPPPISTQSAEKI